MKAFFPSAVRYNNVKYKAYQHFEISRNEIDTVRKLGGFVMGVSEIQATTPISSAKKRNYKKKTVVEKPIIVEDDLSNKEGD